MCLVNSTSKYEWLGGKNTSSYRDTVSWTSNNYCRRMAKRVVVGRKMRRYCIWCFPHNWHFPTEITLRLICISKFENTFATVWFTYLTYTDLFEFNLILFTMFLSFFSLLCFWTVLKTFMSFRSLSKYHFLWEGFIYSQVKINYCFLLLW